MRAVFEMLGIQDVVAKSIGSQNPYNMVRATIDGLKKKSVQELLLVEEVKNFLRL